MAKIAQQQQEPEEQKKEHVDERDQKITELTEQLAEKDGLYRRALADYSNLQKRNEEQGVKRIQLGIAGFVEDLLEPMRNLELQYTHSQDKILGLVLQQVSQAFKKHGIQEVGKEGEEFNADTMEAIERAEGDEGKVVKVVEKGYVLDWVVIRPAKVIVGMKKI